MKWTVVMLPVGFKEFKKVYFIFFFAIFFFSLALSIDKRSILAKIWWGCSLPSAPSPSPRFLRACINLEETLMP